MFEGFPSALIVACRLTFSVEVVEAAQLVELDMVVVLDDEDDEIVEEDVLEDGIKALNPGLLFKDVAEQVVDDEEEEFIEAKKDAEEEEEEVEAEVR